MQGIKKAKSPPKKPAIKIPKKELLSSLFIKVLALIILSFLISFLTDSRFVILVWVLSACTFKSFLSGIISPDTGLLFNATGILKLTSVGGKHWRSLQTINSKTPSTIVFGLFN